MTRLAERTFTEARGVKPIGTALFAPVTVHSPAAGQPSVVDNARGKEGAPLEQLAPTMTGATTEPDLDVDEQARFISRRSAVSGHEHDGNHSNSGALSEQALTEHATAADRSERIAEQQPERSVAIPARTREVVASVSRTSVSNRALHTSSMLDSATAKPTAIERDGVVFPLEDTDTKKDKRALGLTEKKSPPHFELEAPQGRLEIDETRPRREREPARSAVPPSPRAVRPVPVTSERAAVSLAAIEDRARSGIDVATAPIRITIGHVEVRAVLSPESAKKRPVAENTRPRLSLDEYLQRRGDGWGGGRP